MNGRYESFTVRVWTRAGCVQRGEIVHVSTGELLRFTSVQRAAEFIEEQVAGGDARAAEQVRPAGSQGHGDNGRSE